MGFGKATSSSKAMKIIDTEKKISVLIVEDDPLIQKIHKVMMTKFGTEVQVVANGKEVVDLYRSGASFDLILMDFEMPIMDGFEATKELRSMGVTSMIVGVTSRSQDSEIQAFMKSGLNACYVKPLNAEKVTAVLNELKNN
ncbi:Two-component response regulator ARR22 [Vitis vinifera]|uniref:Two-component response regulator ARR22 n=1 Tax=Vitis vinifera TaxID=29760 RepID=A0A438JQL6_VITVI|nr:Two-component response regulator ARR22 [Vitis vinifera]